MSKIDKALIELYRKPSQAEAPELFKTVNELARKAGVAPPAIHFLRTDIPLPKFARIMLDWLIGVLPGENMIMGNKIMAVLGVNNPKKPITEEFSAIIAHELGHIKNNDLTISKLAKNSPLIGAAIAMTSLAMFEHYHEQKKEERKSEEKLPGEEGYSYKQEAQNRRNPLGLLLTTAKYLAASAIGIGAGFFVMKTVHHRLEFRADKFSAELIGSGKPLIRAIETLSDALKKESHRVVEVLRETGLPDSQIYKIIKINDFWAKITHPPTAKRIERLGGF